jgi:6-phosphogluconolactonase (cycloisomerase 2 family)
VTTNGTYFFGANAGSATVTSYAIGASGVPTIVGDATTDPGPVDLTASPDGRSLFVETGASDLVDSFAVQANGTLVATGSAAPELPGPNGLEGIAVGYSF